MRLRSRFMLAPALVFTLALAPLAGLSVLVVTQTACPKSTSLASISGRVERGLNAAIPIFQQNGQNAASLIQARDLAHRAKLAFEASNGVEGAELVARLITVFEGDILAQIARIPNAITRTILLVALTVTNDQLHELVDRLEKAAPKQAGIKAESVDVVKSFQAKKKWRCRDSQTGNIVGMGYCKAHPEAAAVETLSYINGIG